MSSGRMLLVFGLRGTLLERLAAAETPTAISRPPSHVFAKYNVWTRPGVHTILEKLSEKCDLAIWSATPQRNTTPLVNLVFPTIPFKFVWHRDQTIPDTLRRGMATRDDDRHEAHAILKPMSSIYRDNPMYSATRTINVDDGCYKTRQDVGNMLLLPTYDIECVAKETAASAASTVDPVLEKMRQVIEESLVGLTDVRTVLPRMVFI